MANELSPAEKAIRDVAAVIEGWPGHGAGDLDLIRDIGRIVGRYEYERLSHE